MSQEVLQPAGRCELHSRVPAWLPCSRAFTVLSMSCARGLRASSLLGTPHCRKLSIGCEHLDACLDGGIDTVGLTEIAGEAGTGKTQFALQLMLQSQLPVESGGLAGGAIYLHGDGPSSQPAMRRFRSLAADFAARHAGSAERCGELQSNVHVRQVETPEELWEVVDLAIPGIVVEQPVRLLVIDSIAGLYRTPAEGAAAPSAATHGQRAQHLVRLAARLKQISHHYDLAVVIINQVSDKPLDEPRRRAAAPWELGACGTADGGSRVPALGLAWGSCVNTRLMLTRTRAAEAVGTPSRHLHVAWSPRLADSSVAFEVTDRGVVGQPPGVMPQLCHAPWMLYDTATSGSPW